MEWFIIVTIILLILIITGIILIVNKKSFTACKESIDCNEGHECIDGVCLVNNCEEDDDCKDWEICIDHRCNIPECKVDDDCEEDYQCSNYRCKAKPYDGCIINEDCEDPDLKCLNKECVEIECSHAVPCEYRDDWCDYENNECYEPMCGGGPEVEHTDQDDIQCTTLKPQLCSGDACVCWRGLCIKPDCTNTADCTEPGEVCDLVNYECGFFQCTTENNTCPAAFPICLVEEGEDIGLCAHKMCATTADCVQFQKDGEHLACDLETFQCIAADCGYPDIQCPYPEGCIHEQCHAGEVCEDHLCVDALRCNPDGTCAGDAQCILGFCHQVKCNNTTHLCALNHVCDPEGECLMKMCTANNIQPNECEGFNNKACNSLSQCISAECGAYGLVCEAGLDCKDYMCVGTTPCKKLTDCPDENEHCIGTSAGFFCHIDACNNDSTPCPAGEDCIDGLCRESECHSYGTEGIAQCAAYYTAADKLVCDAEMELCVEPTCGTPETATCPTGYTCPPGSSCIGGFNCNTNTYQCEAAQDCTSTHCPPGSHCILIGTKHYCHAGCNDMHPCKGGLFCNDGNECVEGSCTNDAMCTGDPGPGAELKCNLKNHQCERYECDGDASCAVHNVGIKHFVCDEFTHSCKERDCNQASDCGPGFYCLENRCSTGECNTDVDCANYTGPNKLPPGSHYCDIDTHLCEEKECGYEGHICNPTESCSVYKNTDCEWGKYCDLTNQYSCATATHNNYDQHYYYQAGHKRGICGQRSGVNTGFVADNSKWEGTYSSHSMGRSHDDCKNICSSDFNCKSIFITEYDGDLICYKSTKEIVVSGDKLPWVDVFDFGNSRGQAWHYNRYFSK